MIGLGRGDPTGRLATPSQSLAVRPTLYSTPATSLDALAYICGRPCRWQVVKPFQLPMAARSRKQSDTRFNSVMPRSFPFDRGSSSNGQPQSIVSGTTQSHIFVPICVRLIWHELHRTSIK